MQAGDCSNVPQRVLYKFWTLWKRPSCTEGSCTCTGSTPCPWLEQSPRSCHAAPPGPRRLPPGNAKSRTWQFSTGTCLPALPVISTVIPLPLPPNKCSREWEHPRVLVSLCNMIQTPRSLWNPGPPLELNLKSHWVPEYRAGILPAAHSAEVPRSGISKHLKNFRSTWTSPDLPASLRPAKSGQESHQKPAIKSSPTLGSSFFAVSSLGAGKTRHHLELRAAEGASRALGPPPAHLHYWEPGDPLGPPHPSPRSILLPPSPTARQASTVVLALQGTGPARSSCERFTDALVLSRHFGLQEAPVAPDLGGSRPRRGSGRAPAMGRWEAFVGSLLTVSPHGTASCLWHR